MEESLIPPPLETWMASISPCFCVWTPHAYHASPIADVRKTSKKNVSSLLPGQSLSHFHYWSQRPVNGPKICHCATRATRKAAQMGPAKVRYQPWQRCWESSGSIAAQAEIWLRKLRVHVFPWENAEHSRKCWILCDGETWKMTREDGETTRRSLLFALSMVKQPWPNMKNQRKKHHFEATSFSSSVGDHRTQTRGGKWQFSMMYSWSWA